MEGEGSPSKRAKVDEDGVEIEMSDREKKLLADLVLARDALQAMKDMVSRGVRYDAASASRAVLEEEVSMLKRENDRLRISLAELRMMLERREKGLSRLEKALLEEGCALEMARRVTTRVLAPPSLTLRIVEEEGSKKKREENTTSSTAGSSVRSLVAKTRLKPPICIVLEGELADSDPPFQVRAMARVGPIAADGALAGEVQMTVDKKSNQVVFSKLCFVHLSSAYDGLPFVLSFVLCQYGVPLNPPVEVMWGEVEVVSRKRKPE